MRFLAASCAILFSQGCSSVSKEAQINAPFTAQLGSVEFAFPKDQMFFQVSLYLHPDSTANFIGFRLCEVHGKKRERPHGCEAFDRLLIDDGVKLLLMSPEHWTRFSAIRERPQLDTPAAAPLLPTSLCSNVLLMGSKAPPGEHYYLSRLEAVFPGSIQTTNQQWPLIACRRFGDRQACTIGFAVRDVFVEARWNSTTERNLDQRQVWDIATAVDSAVRSRIKAIRKSRDKERKRDVLCLNEC